MREASIKGYCVHWQYMYMRQASIKGAANVGLSIILDYLSKECQPFSMWDNKSKFTGTHKLRNIQTTNTSPK